MIKAKSLQYTYAGIENPALQNISLHVSQGSVLCLCGINGSGKSTLLSLFAGLATPTSGSLVIEGIEAAGNEQHLRQLSALVLQDADLQIIGSTVAEDMLLAFPRNEKTASERAQSMAARFGLTDHWESPVHTLSYGQKRKLCLAVAQLSAPRILLLDEPFSGLDYPAIQEMRTILKNNKELGLTQVISVHDLEPLVDLVDMMVVLHHGKQVLSGPPEAVLDSVRGYGVRPPCSWQYARQIIEWE